MEASALEAARACAHECELASTFVALWEQFSVDVMCEAGLTPKELPDEFARCFPGEVAVVTGATARYVTRPSISWPTTRAPGTYLARRYFSGGEIVERTRPVVLSAPTRANLVARVGAVYDVAGDEKAPLARLVDATASESRSSRTRARIEVVRDARPRAAMEATMLARASQLERAAETLDEYVEETGAIRSFGSAQSHVCSFEVLNILTALASRPEGLELACDYARDSGDELVKNGVPVASLSALRGVGKGAFRDAVSLGHGDDRIVASTSSAVIHATPVAMLAIGRCGISPKSGCAVFGRGPAVGTFCAHAITETGVVVVSGLRRAMRAQRSDGIAPSAEGGPSWPFAFSASADVLGRVHAARTLARDPRSRALVFWGVARQRSDAYGLVRRLMEDGVSEGEAFAIALATHKMPSSPGVCISVEEAARLQDANSNDDIRLDDDESHLRVYDELND